MHNAPRHPFWERGGGGIKKGGGMGKGTSICTEVFKTGEV